MHPCRECDVFIKTGRNHGPDCKGCTKRLDYVEQLGGMTSSVPDELTTYAGNEKGAFMAEQLYQKVCKDPNCTHAGEKQPSCNFPGKRGGGTKDICTECFSRKLKVAHQRRKLERTAKKQSKPQAAQKEKTTVIDLQSRQSPSSNKSFVEFKSIHNLQIGVMSWPGSDRLAIVGLALSGESGLIQHRIMPLRKEAVPILKDLLSSYLKEAE